MLGAGQATVQGGVDGGLIVGEQGGNVEPEAGEGTRTDDSVRIGGQRLEAAIALRQNQRRLLRPF